MRHDFIKTGDADSFAAIQDRNGEVVLSFCRRCRRGEGELSAECPGIADDRIWIVEGRCGEYSDRTEWPVAWCATEAEANALRDKCQQENDGLTESERDGIYEGRRPSRLVSDPSWRSDYTGTRYSVYSLDRWPNTRSPSETKE